MLDDSDAARRVSLVLDRSRPHSQPALRVLLAACSLTQLVIAFPWLFGASLIPDQQVSLSHLTRDGALGLVVATVGLMVAWRPRYWLSGIAIGSIVFALQIAAGLVDDRDRYVNGTFELAHVIVILILVLIAAISSSPRRDTPSARPRPDVVRAV